MRPLHRRRWLSMHCRMGRSSVTTAWCCVRSARGAVSRTVVRRAAVANLAAHLAALLQAMADGRLSAGTREVDRLVGALPALPVMLGDRQSLVQDELVARRARMMRVMSVPVLTVSWLGWSTACQ